MRMVMMGTGRFAEPTLAALLKAADHVVAGLVTNPDRPSGRGRDMERNIKRLALDHAIPVFQPEKINTAEGISGLVALRPELLVVAAYGQILSRDVLGTAPRGGINVHASLLPKYRGAAPIAWAISHGETRTGVTIIRMSVALDAGDMLRQEPLEIRPNETAGELEERLAPLGARLALETVELLAGGPLQGVKQDPTQVTRAPKLTKEHGLIDWSRPAMCVCNQIRAMQPWPTAYSFWHAPGRPTQRLIVWKAAPMDGPSAEPGQFLDRGDSQRLAVAAGAGSAVEILELQPAGKRRMATAEFLRGHPGAPGSRFGQAP